MKIREYYTLTKRSNVAIHDFHNAGHRESPGSSCMKTRSERPKIASRLFLYAMVSASRLFTAFYLVFFIQSIL